MMRKTMPSVSLGLVVVKKCLSWRCVQFYMILLQLRFAERSMCISKFARHKATLSKLRINPLLQNFTGILNFDVGPDDITEAIPRLTTNTKKKFTKFETNLEGIIKENGTLSWDSVVQPIEKINDKLQISWKIVSHLHNVKETNAFRKAYSEALPEVIAIQTKMSQSKPMYEAYKILLKENDDLDEAQKRILASSVKDAYNTGVSLKGEKKKRFNAIVQELAALSTKFSNNVQDSTKEFSITIEDRTQMDGVPETLLRLTAKSAADHLKKKSVDPEKGPWRLTLDSPCFGPFMKHSKNRDLREKMYRAMIARASTGDQDNSEIIESIRSLRREKSQILKFPNFVYLSLNTKMAQKPEAVTEMLQSLKQKSKPIGRKEINELKKFAAENGFDGELMHWDIPYWSERQVESLFRLKEEEMRTYFPLPRVLEGLFKLSSELFGISIKAADGEVDVWDESVRFFKVYDRKGGYLAAFFLDPYARPREKRSGAWMDAAVDRSDSLGRTPIAHLICNQSPPHGDVPSLMTFREVETLFHEFGHGLQHMLTTVKYSQAAGTSNIEWDAVEVPSQFMENWLYDWHTMAYVSGHYKTGEILPKKIFNQVVKSRKHMAGVSMLRQLYYAALDLELHASNDSWKDVMKRVSDEYTIVKPLPEDMFPCSFTHIFSGGYAAGYYSYKWAEVMAADAFSKFENADLNNRKAIAEIGMRFRNTILSLGGGRSPKDVFVDFRGRNPSTNALLQIYGLK